MPQGGAGGFIVTVSRGEYPARARFVIARFDSWSMDWEELAHLSADDRIDALDRWALEQGGFDSLDPGIYGARREDEDEHHWYQRVRDAA